MGIKDKVNKIKNKYGTNNPFELCVLFNIQVIEMELGNINGYYIKVPKNKMIFLNSNLNDLNMKFVCAHEIGHAILHSELNTLFLQQNTLNIKGRFENQANEFAAELCIGDDLLEEYEGYSLNKVSECTGIDIKYLELKFKR